KTKRSSSKRSNPETVIDPSSRHHPQKRQRIDGSLSSQAKDSRGTSSRRKTEEGYSIYKEDELGIGNSGGDTPLCPFDCSCYKCSPAQVSDHPCTRNVSKRQTHLSMSPML
ncbi:hypothetical protein EDD15DRAFT_2211606, partial [Pisolithus albus]